MEAVGTLAGGVAHDLNNILSGILSYPVHLGKTVMNLISNESEAITGRGTVTVTTQNRTIVTAYAGYEIIEPGEYAVLSVADTGEGIPTDNLERVFEPFFTQKVMGRSGTGLGLAVVWGTVKDNGGYVDVSSVPGRGTRFDLYFPRTDQPAIQGNGESTADYQGQKTIIASGFAETQRVSAALDLGAAGYLKKPYTLLELAKKVRKALQIPGG